VASFLKKGNILYIKNSLLLVFKKNDLSFLKKRVNYSLAFCPRKSCVKCLPQGDSGNFLGGKRGRTAVWPVFLLAQQFFI
jgi:hypothetical protein